MKLKIKLLKINSESGNKFKGSPKDLKMKPEVRRSIFCSLYEA